MKKWIALLLAAMMAFALVACGETPNNENKDGSETKTEEFARGEWKDGVYTNASLGLAVTPPEGWVVASDEELAEIMGVVLENTATTAQISEEFLKAQNCYDMMVQDPVTGVKVFSIYGKYREPSQEMLEGIDVMVYDIQDVGTRSYTFISSLGLVMRACAKKGIEVMVLDRPNPLGGLKVEGCCVEPGYYSFVSEFEIPYIYGLTVGELAIMINEEGLNRGEKGYDPALKCKLSVIPMDGWRRKMSYIETGLPWVLPSPNIPYPQSAVNSPVITEAG